LRSDVQAISHVSSESKNDMRGCIEKGRKRRATKKGSSAKNEEEL
jgi:hypothetical protein